MDWSKYPIEKLVYFVAGIIPGFVVLMVFEVARPGSFNWFFQISSLGYKTKLILALLTCFILGYTLTIFVKALIGAGYHAYFQWRPQPYKPSMEYQTAPWRDPRWRLVLRKHLGKDTPNDTSFLGAEVLEYRRKWIESLPKNEQARASLELSSEKFRSDQDDRQWANWYDYYHGVLLQPPDRDLFYHVGYGLRINFEAAATYLLLSSIIVSQLRHWWIWLPAAFLVMLLVAEEASAFERHRNKWSTLSAQIKYLSYTEPGQQGSLF